MIASYRCNIEKNIIFETFPYLKYFLNTYHVGGLWPSPWRHMLIIIYDIWSKRPYLHFFQFVTITTTYFLNTYHLSNLLSSSWNPMRIIISSYDDPHIIIRAISVSIVNPCFILSVTLFGQTSIIVSESLVKLTFF